MVEPGEPEPAITVSPEPELHTLVLEEPSGDLIVIERPPVEEGRVRA